jgi:DNA mismatch repair ATPase MutS
MIAAIRNISSITIGVNLDDSLRPVEATLLAVNKKRFTGPTSSLLSMFFNKDTSLEGIAPLHSIPPKSSLPDGYGLENPMLHPLFRDLAQILKQISRPVAAALQRYLRMNIYGLDKLKVELAFYVGAAKLIQKLRISDLPMCRPELAPMEERVCELESSYNLNLALRMLTTQSNLSQTMITNDVTFGPEGRIFVLTGPNQGGKTTYTQAIGVIQALVQAGLYVPASRARISPVDAIFTHFPVEERPNAESGRLGEEAQRLNDIFSHATRHSLILLNESLSSTSFGESLYLARDIARALRLLGARGIYATHLHELAASVNNLNETSMGDSKLISLVSLVNENGSNSISTRTYKIVTGPPMGHSYAREIAARYGISYEQLAQTLRQRGVVSESLSKRQ